MDKKEFLFHIRSLSIDKHILSGRRGAEENVKIKIIVPLLQCLGWDLLEDMRFEYSGADIVLFREEEPSIIVETKSWGEVITDHLNQCLEYCFKSKTPWVIVSTGQYTALYCALLNPDNLALTEPIIEFSYDKLVGNKGQRLIERLDGLIGKGNFSDKNNELYSIVEKRLEKRTIEDAQSEFLTKATNYKANTKYLRLTEKGFFSLLNKHPKKLRDALTFLYEEMVNLPKLDKNISLRYRSKEIGLGYFLKKHPRNKQIGLFGIYPEKAQFALGLRGWEELNISKSTFDKLKKSPHKAQSKQWAINLVSLLKSAIKEIK
jgi:hypothetical protein